VKNLGEGMDEIRQENISEPVRRDLRRIPKGGLTADDWIDWMVEELKREYTGGSSAEN
jgi:hypothetical protein